MERSPGDPKKMQISLSGRGMAEFDASAFSTKDEREMLYAISKLDLSRNKLTLVRGMQCLSNLTSLDVSNNKIKSLAGLPLKLRRLDVSSNDLKFLDGLTPLSQLEWINVSGNELVSLSGLPGTNTLHHVDASRNRLPNLKGVELCVGIHELLVSQNLLRKVDDLISLRYLRSIRHLSIGDNPVTSNPRNATAIRLLVPKVTTLDGVGAGGGGDVSPPSGLNQQRGSSALPLAPPTQGNTSGQARVVVRSSSNPGSRPTTPTNTSALSLSTIQNGGNSMLGGGAVGTDTSMRQQLRAVEASVRAPPSPKDTLYLSLLRTLDSSKRRASPAASPKGRAQSADAYASGNSSRRFSSPAGGHDDTTITGPDATAPPAASSRHATTTVVATQRPTSPAMARQISDSVNHGRAALDVSVPALMSQRVMQQRIDELERQLESTKMQLANANRDAENYKLQVKQLKDTVDRQAKINSLLADRNLEFSNAISSTIVQQQQQQAPNPPIAPRVSLTGEGAGGLQYVVHTAVPATHRNSMTESTERRSSSAQHRGSAERNSSPPNERVAPRPSPTRNVTSPTAVKQTIIGGYARKQPTPTAAPTSTVSGGGKKSRRSDLSPRRGTHAGEVPLLNPQDAPALKLHNYTAALAKESSRGAAQPSTPRQQLQQQQLQSSLQTSKNVSFGGSQFYSPPPTYYS